MKDLLQITLYKDGADTGSIVFKCKPWHYKISCAAELLRFEASIQQLIRAITAGSRRNGKFFLNGCAQDLWLLEYQFKNELLHLTLWEYISTTKPEIAFNWQGQFEEFREGFKTF